MIDKIPQKMVEEGVRFVENTEQVKHLRMYDGDLVAAIADIGVAPATLVINVVPDTLLADLDLSATNIHLVWNRGCVLDTGVYEFTVNTLSAGKYQLFTNDSYVYGLVDTQREWFGYTTSTKTSNIDNWIPRDSTDKDVGLVSVAWSSELGLFAAVGGTGTPSINGILTSPDGKNWTEQTMPLDQVWTEVIWASGPAVFVAVAITGATQRVMTSADGIIWTARDTPDTAYRSIAWSPDVGDVTKGRLCAVTNASTGTRVITSDDGGITWVNRSYPFGDETWVSVEWLSGLQLFFVTGVNTISGQAMTSPDGITWTRRGSAAAAGDNWQASAWSPELNLLVVVLNTGTNRVRTSKDAVNFEEQATPNIPGFGNPSYHDVLWIPEWMQFVSIANTGLGFHAMSSYDGKTWTVRHTAMHNSWEGLAWSPELDLLVAVSDNTQPSAIGNHIMTTSGSNMQEPKPATLGFNRTIRKDKKIIQSVTSSTTLVEIEGFTQEYEAGDVVNMLMTLRVDAAAAGDIKLTTAYIGGTGAVAGQWGVVGGGKFDASDTWVRALAVGLGSNIIFGCAGAGQYVSINLWASFRVTNSRVKIGMKFTQNVANATPTNIHPESFILIVH